MVVLEQEFITLENIQMSLWSQSYKQMMWECKKECFHKLKCHNQYYIIYHVIPHVCMTL